MAQDAQLISQAGQVESLASDGLVSVSTGAGQPQKNMELAKFADSLGSSVPLQQTSEQVSITGLYARTSDGKMVELTKESVASVVAGLIPELSFAGTIMDGNLDDYTKKGRWFVPSNSSINGKPTFASSNGWYLIVNEFDGTIFQEYVSTDGILNSWRIRYGTTWKNWSRIDNFGYNTLAELSSGVAGQMGNPAGYKGDKSNIDANTITSSGLYYLNGGITNALEWSYLMVFSFGSANDVVQINTHNSENLTKIRKCAGGTWSSWQTL